MNFGGRTRRLEFPSQMMHMNWDRVGFQFVIDAIEPFFEHRLRYHTTEPPHQVFENCAFAPRQRQGRGSDAHVAPDCMK
jgi:hypothetical protein